MSNNKRTPIIAGNWKMNMTCTEATVLVEELKEGLGTHAACEVVVCPPFTALSTVRDLIEDTPIVLGAQNVFHEENGAYTGEVSPAMLTDLGVEYVILGHSERREIFKEKDACINKRVKIVLKHGMKPILCVGETLGQRESGETMALIQSQLDSGLHGVSKEEMRSVVIAYEPIWAIGTGRVATAEQAEEVCAGIRKYIGKLFDDEVAHDVRIQYGGSVKANNAKELLEQPDIDGALVGGASLKSKDFLGIVRACQ